MAKRHIIPEFYLKWFVSPTLDPKHTPWLWVHDGATKSWSKKFLGNLTTRPDYYDLTDTDGQTSTHLEEWLSKVEVAAKRAIERSISDWGPPSDQEREAIALFVATCFVRVPQVHSNIADFMNKTMRKALRITMDRARADPKVWEGLKAQLLESNPAIDLEGITPEQLIGGEEDISIDEETPKRIIFSCVQTPFNLLLNMGWQFWISNPSDIFITSDNPVTVIDPTNPRGFYSRGFANPNVEVTCPLTRNVSFLAHWKNTDAAQYVGAKREAVEMLNSRCVDGATQLFSSEQAFPGAAQILALKGPDGNSRG